MSPGRPCEYFVNHFGLIWEPTAYEYEQGVPFWEQAKNIIGGQHPLFPVRRFLVAALEREVKKVRNVTR
jgi:hypothetical protein